MIRWLAVLLLPAVLSSCTPAPPTPSAEPATLDPTAVDGDRALEEVRRFLAVGPRVSGTPGAQKAASHLATRLRELGLDPVTDEFTDPTPAGAVTFRNVTAVIPGTPGMSADDTPRSALRVPILLLASHYDTKSGISDDFVGANDSGSSTGLLLELARVLQQGPAINVDIMIAFLDGEECRTRYGKSDGLHGSRRLASEFKKDGKAEEVVAVIVLDMIGDADLTVTIPRNSTDSLTALVFNAAREEGVRLKFSLARGDILDDHVPFLEAGMPAIDIIDFEFGSVPGANDYWHTSQDVIDKLSADSLQTVGRVVVRMINGLLNP